MNKVYLHQVEIFVESMLTSKYSLRLARVQYVCSVENIKPEVGKNIR